jgi:4-amino-4-deoxy-L-arabinose transferase-like glycosyltransferase
MKLPKYLGFLFLIVWLTALVLAVNFPAITSLSVIVALLVSAAGVFVWLGWIQSPSEENSGNETGERIMTQDSQASVFKE